MPAPTEIIEEYYWPNGLDEHKWSNWRLANVVSSVFAYWCVFGRCSWKFECASWEARFNVARKSGMISNFGRNLLLLICRSTTTNFCSTRTFLASIHCRLVHFERKMTKRRHWSKIPNLDSASLTLWTCKMVWTRTLNDFNWNADEVTTKRLRLIFRLLLNILPKLFSVKWPWKSFSYGVSAHWQILNKFRASCKCWSIEVKCKYRTLLQQVVDVSCLEYLFDSFVSF